MSMIRGQVKVAKLIGVSRSVLWRKIQPAMIELGEAQKNGKATADVYFDSDAIERWRQCLIDVGERRGREKKPDYKEMYLAWLGKEKEG